MNCTENSVFYPFLSAESKTFGPNWKILTALSLVGARYNIEFINMSLLSIVLTDFEILCFSSHLV